MTLNYNYDATRAYAKACNIAIMDDKLVEFDQLAFANAFTQGQVDVAMQAHIRQIAIAFTPGTYSFKQRIIIALYFLIGWRK